MNVSANKDLEPKMRENANMAKSITGRITLNLVGGIFLTIVAVSGGIVFMAQSQNEQATTATVTMVQGGLNATADQTKSLANDYGWWNDNYDAYVSDDVTWLDDNVGASVYDTQITDLIAYLSPQGTLKHGWILDGYGVSVDDVFTDGVIAGILKLAKDMPVESTAARSTYISVGDQVLVVSVSRVVPIQHLEDVQKENLPFFIAGYFLSEDLLHTLGESFLIDDLHFVPSPDADSAMYDAFPELVTINGNRAGRLIWTPPTPGFAVLQNVAVPIGVALLIFTIIALLVAYRARRIAEALSRAYQDLQVSEQALAEQLVAVASEKEKIETIVSSIGEGILVVDESGKVFLSNKTAASLLDKKENEILNNSLENLFDIQTKRGKPKSAFAPMLDVLKTRKTTKVSEASFTRTDGNLVILSMTAAPVELDGTFMGAIIVFHDVTEEKLVEAAKQQFITTAAHQLRTPLAGIRWAMGLLLDGSMGEVQQEQKDLIKKSYESVDRLSLLINDLLNIDKLEAVEGKFASAPTDVETPIHGVLNELSSQIERKNIKVDMVIEAGLPNVAFGVESSQIVFQNLIENAVRYTKTGGTITIGAKKEDKKIHVTVTDSGIGIPLSERENIFARFYRASNAVLLEPDGSGLGLYIAKQIVDRHGGEIWFESQEGKGTTFHVLMPVAKAMPKKAVLKPEGSSTPA